MAKAKAKAKPRVLARAKASLRKRSAARPAAKTAAKASARRPVKRKAAAPKRPKQTFVVSHHNEADFDAGLRSYAKYRDLGIAQATGGMVQAHVIRMVPPCDPKVVSKRHYHDVEFQMIYILKGWMKGEYEGQVVTLREGSCWIQPPRIKHTVLDYSDDCEMLEIILPAEFDTVELE
jgi:mannose-6-phosphate isomerase-like protein (cupin superfamily)